MDYECEDLLFFGSCVGVLGLIDSDGDERGLSDDEVGLVEGCDEEENLKKFVQDSIFCLVEMKQKMGCFINYFEEFFQWGKDLYISENNDVVIYWFRNWDGV